MHETGEYKRNFSTQVSKKDKNQGTVTHEPYYRQLEEVMKQSSETPMTYWLDRAVGSPTPLQFAAGSDIVSDLSATSEISSISSKGKSDSLILIEVTNTIKQQYICYFCSNNTTQAFIF
ncbi:unnamed protein product [Rodentolepis nana]|uniref:Ovule protein n=1 Tax=Rodentolepis nana TaxID=102285 RepID=A0A0R3TDX8_RODNA|nr:unnamed protein product [Rodentolepis nana]